MTRRKGGHAGLTKIKAQDRVRRSSIRDRESCSTTERKTRTNHTTRQQYSLEFLSGGIAQSGTAQVLQQPRFAFLRTSNALLRPVTFPTCAWKMIGDGIQSCWMVDKALRCHSPLFQYLAVKPFSGLYKIRGRWRSNLAKSEQDHIFIVW